MSLSVGIVGLPNVGKSTLFNALTNNNVLAANYPFATIEPNTGMVPVPDERLGKLAALYESGKIVPATVTFVDIAGLVRGASEGEGLGNQFLGHIRATDAIVQVVRAFEDENIQHVENRVEPKADIETINTELILADLSTVDNRLKRLESEVKGDPKLAELKQLVEKVKTGLDSGRLAGSFLTGEELAEIRDLQLLTAKPFIIVFNLAEPQLNDQAFKQKLADMAAPSPAVFLCAKIESELADLSAEESAELLQELGQKEPGLSQLIQAAYSALGLQTFLTAGPKETRAWTIHKGDTAPKAAGVIHTDFERGFIRADVVNWKDLVESGSLTAARSKGKVRSEGKDYIMKEGDVVEFKFNV